MSDGDLSQELIFRKLRKAFTRLERADSRITRRNARRAAFGLLRSIRHTLDTQYPAIAKPPKQADADLRLVQKKTWREVEYRIVKPGERRWDRAVAQEFVDWFATSHGCAPKPIRFDIPDGSRYLGQHATDSIRIKAVARAGEKPDAEKWRILLHEVAHYRAKGHGRAFKLELVYVYRTWRQWMRDRKMVDADRNAHEEAASLKGRGVSPASWGRGDGRNIIPPLYIQEQRRAQHWPVE